MTTGSRMSLTMGLIGPEQRELFALENLASTNINQSAPNLVKTYMTIRFQMSLIMGLIRPEQPELFVLDLKKIAIFHFVLCLHSSIYKYKPISTKLGSKYI